MAASVSVVPVPRLKDYIFTDKLGSGTYATVFKAYRKGGPREVVAVKCVQKKSLNKVATENLLTEIELLKTLNHENIVCLKDFQWDENYIYLIMEFCNGGDLSRLIHSQRTLSEYMAKRFLQQIALALQYMRKKNVSHMDLKPPNILLSSLENPVLKLGDFGFAHYLIGETEADFLRGSPLYMAPELIIKRQYNEKADLWSVGVIMYECLFGRAPFSSKSLTELHEKIKSTKPIELPYGVKVSRECRDLLHGLLQRDPEQRMDYDTFFSHSFVDLEHRPERNSLQRATSLVTEAVKYDSEGDFQKAVDYYCKAMQHFVPAIHYEKDQRRKQTLRTKVKEYMNRAEELKAVLKPVPVPLMAQPSHLNKEQPPSSVPKAIPIPVTIPPNNVTGEQAEPVTSGLMSAPVPSAKEKEVEPEPEYCQTYAELSQQFIDNPDLQAAIGVIHEAHFKEEKELYDAALEKYELALETLIKITQEEPKGKRRNMLQQHISDWMTRAERIKEYLNVKDMKTEDTSLQEEMESRRFFSALGSSCCIQ